MSDKLNIGDKLGNFELKDHKGNTVNLENLKGKKVLLSFHPLAWTSVCRDQMKSLEENYDKFSEYNTIPFGLSIDTTFTKNAWAKEIGIEKVRLLSDFWPTGELAKRLDVFREKDGFTERANILLDEEGKIIWKKVYPISELPDLKEIFDLIS